MKRIPHTLSTIATAALVAGVAGAQSTIGAVQAVGSVESSSSNGGNNNNNNSSDKKGPAKNVIFFVGDGMGVSTVTATRVYSVGIDGKLTVDKFPYTALSKTYTSDHITPDSAGTMTAMMSGVNTNSGVIGFGPKTERRDFNQDGDVGVVTTLLEMAKMAGKRVGVVSTARLTHATPAACYAKVNERGLENEIALQALPGSKTYNKKLGSGIDLLMGGGRRHFFPDTMTGEEGSSGRRTDGLDLRAEFQKQGYKYIWNDVQFAQLSKADLPLLALFESSHMEYEYDRPQDAGGEPSLTQMVERSIDLLSHKNKDGYFLMVESGRIDHAHHAGNAWRCMLDTEEFDEAIEAAVFKCNLKNTLIVVTADHSHVFNIAGYPLRPRNELPYKVTKAAANWQSPYGGIFGTVFGLNASTGEVGEVGDANSTPYTILGYLNGPGYRGGARVDPASDPFKGLGGATVSGPLDPNYLQESAVPLGSETHSGEEVAIYAIGAGSSKLRGTVKNTRCFELMREAMFKK